MNIEKLKEEFTKYITNNFDIEEKPIERELERTFRVANNAINIVKKEEDNQSYKEIAFLIGLFHDFGRFFQWDKYKTFVDHESEDHGDLGVKMLFDNKIIEKFSVPVEHYDIIRNAVYNHNKKRIVNFKELDPLEIFFCRLIRDADKLDLLDMMLEGTFPKKSPLKGLTWNVWEDFVSRKPVGFENVKTRLDWKLSNYSLIFGLNFKYSFEWLVNNNFLKKHFEQMLSVMDKDELMILCKAVNHLAKTFNLEGVSYYKEKENEKSEYEEGT